MPSFYSVVRYVPDVIADERINIGVVVFGEGRIRAHFLQNWQRVQRFGGGSVAFLKNFAKEFPQAQLHLLFESPKWDEASLQKVVGKWKNCIQLSEAYASLKSVDELLAEVTNRFLREEQSHAQTAVRESYGRSRVVSDGIRIVKAVLSEHVGRRIASEIVKKNHPLSGKRGEHHFDIVVANGRPIFAADALSFEMRDTMQLLKDLDAAAFAIEDVKKKNRDLPLAVIVKPPKRESEAYKSAKLIFGDLKVPLLPPQRAGDWAEEIVQKVQLPVNDSG